MKIANSDHLSAAVGLLNLDLEKINASHCTGEKKEAVDCITLEKNGCPKKNFPSKLFDVIADEANSDIIMWLPGGKAFVIQDKKRFASEILPRYFKQSQFTSFTRKLTRWNFERVTRGLLMGAYFHKYFQKDNPSLCRMMTCQSPDSSLMEISHTNRIDVLNHSSNDLMSLLMYKQSVEEESVAEQALQAREQRIRQLLEIRRREKACEELELKLLQPYDQTFKGRNITGCFDVNAEINARKILARANYLARARLSAQSQLPPWSSNPSSLATAMDRVRSERELLRGCFRSPCP